MATKVQSLSREQREQQQDWDNRPRGGVILMNAEGRVLVLKDRLNGKWGFPKGAIEECDNESLLATAIRECEEETGLKAGVDFELYPQRFMPHYHNLYFVAALADGAAARLSPQEAEVSAIEWIDVQRCSIPWNEMNAPLRYFLKKWV